ncbi:MAG: DUF4190 domain-containing protein [Acidobacteriota bacterium]|nr:DUF4190 domain-containing protein [Acidobacteriota bacterium]MDH3530363.1 DUF4190 domain-containing protein [Acidobacteriota bacterium]
MKICPKCNQQYDDDNLNFCLSDGEMLMETQDADATPTVYMDAPRVTNQNWEPQPDPMVQQQNPQDQQIFQQPFSAPQNYPKVVSQDKTLPTVSLVLGILSLVLMCCYLGVPLGAGAAITGFIGMSRVNSDPSTFGGKELAIIGMVLGGISFVLSILLIIGGVLSSIFD